MGPDDYVPFCEQLGWPEWKIDGSLFRLFWNRTCAMWKYQIHGRPSSNIWHDDDDAVCDHVALCILEKWAREKFIKAGINIIQLGETWYAEKMGGGYLALDGTEWRFWGWNNATRFSTYHAAAVAVLKTICKETDDGKAEEV